MIMMLRIFISGHERFECDVRVRLKHMERSVQYLRLLVNCTLRTWHVG